MQGAICEPGENPASPPYGGSVGQRDSAPWKTIGMSRSNWYRLGKPSEKPRKYETQAQTARQLAISVRRLQRAARVHREAPQLVRFIKLGLLKSGTAEKYLGHPDRLACLIADLQERAALLKVTPSDAFN
jgi:hypothetical protein